MRWQGRMADEVAATRATVTRALALLESVPRNYPGQPRDPDGQFAGGSFGDRAQHATTGPAAVAAARPGREPTQDELAALDEYGGSGFDAINSGLRSSGGRLEPADHQATAQNLDSLMHDSPLRQELLVHRNVMATETFGDAASGDMTGMTWRDHGYVSTSGAERPRFHQATVMRVLVPAGTPAVSSRLLDRDEVLLGRGLTFKVVSDNGPASAVRRVDVEVIAP